MAVNVTVVDTVCVCKVGDKIIVVPEMLSAVRARENENNASSHPVEDGKRFEMVA